MNIPEEALNAAAFAFWGKSICTDSECEGCEYELSETRSALEAAMPAIEQELRKQIAAEVRLAGKRTSRCLTFEPDNCDGCHTRDEVAAFAAKIAEGFRS